MSEVYNAKITGTMLGVEDHGIMTCFVYLEFEHSGIGFGGYGLDEWDEELNRRVDKRGYTGEFIKEVMHVVGVEKWEDLKGKYCRIELENWSGPVTKIGHLIEDRWFCPKEWFKQHE